MLDGGEDGIWVDPDNERDCEFTGFHSDIIGMHIRIYWSKEQQWFHGRIMDWDRKVQEYRIDYDDGDRKWTNLEKRKVGSREYALLLHRYVEQSAEWWVLWTSRLRILLACCGDGGIPALFPAFARLTFSASLLPHRTCTSYTNDDDDNDDDDRCSHSRKRHTPQYTLTGKRRRRSSRSPVADGRRPRRLERRSSGRDVFGRDEDDAHRGGSGGSGGRGGGRRDYSPRSLRIISNKGRDLLADSLAEHAADVEFGDLLGKRVRVYWPAERAWFAGKVIDQRYGRNDDEYYVQYDDGDERWVKPQPDRFEVLAGEYSIRRTDSGAAAGGGRGRGRDRDRDGGRRRRRRTPSPPPIHTRPESVVPQGSRVDVYVAKYRQWCKGVVSDHDDRRGDTHIMFDDGTDEWLDLTHTDYKLLTPGSTRNSSSSSSSSGGGGGRVRRNSSKLMDVQRDLDRF